MNQDRGQQEEKHIRYQIAGWFLFIICAILFAASALKNRDMLTFAGSIVFLGACIVFLIPLLGAQKSGK
ncbi:MAG: hypothetical protein ACQETG_00365 [Thermodesulfobacteriota bacterium]